MRGLLLKEQIANGKSEVKQYGLQELDSKELLALRAKNVNNSVLQSRQKYHERLKKPPGDSNPLTQSKSQKVLKKNN